MVESCARQPFENAMALRQSRAGDGRDDSGLHLRLLDDAHLYETVVPAVVRLTAPCWKFWAHSEVVDWHRGFSVGYPSLPFS